MTNSESIKHRLQRISETSTFTTYKRVLIGCILALPLSHHNCTDTVYRDVFTASCLSKHRLTQIGVHLTHHTTQRIKRQKVLLGESQLHPDPTPNQGD